MVKRRIREHFQATDIRFQDGSLGPVKVGVVLDVNSRGLTNKEYVRQSLSETLHRPVATFELSVVEQAEPTE